MTSFSSMQYTSSGTPRVFPQVKKQVHLEKDARSSDVLHFVCFRVETWNCMHFLVILSLKTLSNIEEQLCIIFMYVGTHISSPVIQKCVHLKCFCFVYDVWTTDLGFCQVSLLTHFPWQGWKHCNFIWPSLPFSLPHIRYFFSLSPFFFHDLWLGYLVYSRVTLDLWLILIHRDLWNSQKWQILISVNRDLDFFLLTEICDQKPHPLFRVFVYWRGVLNRSKFPNIFFFNFHLIPPS